MSGCLDQGSLMRIKPFAKIGDKEKMVGQPELGVIFMDSQEYFVGKIDSIQVLFVMGRRGPTFYQTMARARS